MCSELCKDFYVVYQLEMVADEVESSCQLVVTFFFLVSPYQTIEISLGQPSPPSYQLLPPPLIVLKVSCSVLPSLVVSYLLIQVMKSLQLLSIFIPLNETGMTYLVS